MTTSGASSQKSSRRRMLLRGIVTVSVTFHHVAEAMDGTDTRSEGFQFGPQTGDVHFDRVLGQAGVAAADRLGHGLLADDLVDVSQQMFEYGPLADRQVQGMLAMPGALGIQVHCQGTMRELAGTRRVPPQMRAHSRHEL